MKKIIAALAFAGICLPALAQSFAKGNTVVTVGAGFAFYKVYSYEKDTPYYTNDTAAAFVFPLKVEYGIFDWLGAAFRFNYSNYIEGDSANTQDVNGIDLGLQANFHFYRGARTDLYAGGIASWSRLRYSESTVSNIQVKGGGSVFGAELGARFYFGESKKSGIHFAFSYLGNFYPNLVATDAAGNTADYYLSATGFQLGLGLNLKI
ncbi:MAG: outer membrane beta-barrel protein [Bacteroidota bacterium]